MRRFLVTGGAGFIGSNFVRYVLRRHPDVTVTVLDKLTYAGNRENLRDLDGDRRFRFELGDIADAATVAALLQRGAYDAIVNFAAESHVDRSIVDSAAFLQTNVVGTQVLLEAASRAVPKPLFVQVSTDEVYGSTTPDHPFMEASLLNPSSPYSASKAGADLMVLAYGVTHGLRVAITRSSNNYGPYQYPEKFIPLAITNALEDRPIPLYGDGLNIRDWLYVEDNCEAIDRIVDWALTHTSAESPIFNIGSGERRSNREVLQILLAMLGQPQSLIRPVPDRPGHDRCYALQTTKLRDAVGWIPRTTFEEGLRRTIAWYRERVGWWQPLKQRAAPHWLAAEAVKRSGEP